MGNTITLLDVSGTYYRSRCAKKGDKLESIMAWINKIKDGTFKETIESYRKHLQEDEDLTVANQIKHSLPALVPSANCINGRVEGQELGLTRLFMADYDHLGKELAETKRDMLKDFKWVFAAHLTPSYGLRVFIFVPIYLRIEFKDNLNVVLAVLDNILGLEHDRQATNLLRLSFASYDPDAWCRDITDPDVAEFPMQESKALVNAFAVPQESDSNAPEQEETLANFDSDEVLADIVASYSDEAAAQQPPVDMEDEGTRDFSRTELDKLLNRFQEQHTFARGSRNNSFIALGFRAYYLRVSPKSLEELIEITSQLFSDSEYKFRDISSRIYWGYNHATKQVNCKTFSGHFSSHFSKNSKMRESKESKKSNINRVLDSDEDEDSDIQENNNLIINESCPFFPDEVYEKIPDWFSELLTTAPGKRDKDLLLFSIITALSSALPNLTIEIDDNEYSSNLFFFGIGPAGCGKSIALKALKLLEGIEKIYTQRNLVAKKDYEIKLNEWENEQRIAHQAKRSVNYDLMPADKPVPITFLNTGAISRSKLIIDLANNDSGMCIATAELDTLSNSVNADYGKHASELRSIAMNEPVSSNFKTDGRLIKVTFPKLTILATCTPDQMVGFIKGTQDGMLSRSLCMLMSSSEEYRRGRKRSDRDLHRDSIQAYKEAAEKVAAMYEFLEKYPTYIRIPDELREKADDLFEYYNSRILEERHSELKSIINRCVIHTARICSVFTAIRKYETGLTMLDMDIEHDDMQIALAMMKVLLQHTCVAATMLTSNDKVSKLKSVFTREKLLKSLPDEFTTKEFTAICEKKMQYSRSSVYNILAEWTQEEVLFKPKQGVYIKTGNPLPQIVHRQNA